MLQLAALGVTAALCAMALRRGAPELAVLLTLAAGALLLSETLRVATTVKRLTDTLSQATGLSPTLWGPVWKTAGIGIVTKLSAAVCKDAGEGGVAAFLETAGAAAALLAALPLVETVFDMLAGL